MKRCYCYKCGLKYWTPKGAKAIDYCPFCGLSSKQEKNQADNLEAVDKLRILGLKVAEDSNKYG